MPALFHIDWQEPYLGRARRFSRTWIRSVIYDQEGGWSIQLKWLPDDVTIGEGILLVPRVEETVFVLGNKIDLYEGRTLIAKLTVLTNRYDNRLH